MYDNSIYIAPGSEGEVDSELKAQNISQTERYMYYIIKGTIYVK